MLRRHGLTAALWAAACAAAVAMPPADRSAPFRPAWLEGLTWRVRYTVVSPSAAAVAAPRPETHEETWEYRVFRSTAAGERWRIVAREDPPRGDERVELSFTMDIRLAKVVRFDQRGLPHEAFNDAEAGGYRSDTPGTPLLDWPAWDTGTPTWRGFLFELRKKGTNGYAERFRWARGRPWWTQAQRIYGPAMSVKGRLVR